MICKYKIHKERAGYYIYRGFSVHHVPPFGWEGIDEYDCGFAHAKTLRGCTEMIDCILSNKSVEMEVK